MSNQSNRANHSESASSHENPDPGAFAEADSLPSFDSNPVDGAASSEKPHSADGGDSRSDGVSCDSRSTDAGNTIPLPGDVENSQSRSVDLYATESPDKSIDEYATAIPSQADPYATDPPSNTSAATETEAPRAGLRFKRLRHHAEGGLGRVSLAIDSELQRQVAVKEIKEMYADFQESRDRFVFEAEVTGRLEHPGIVPVYALGKHADGRPFYAMRFISGESMDKSIRRLHKETDKAQFDRRLRDLLNRLVSVCNTLNYAHSRGYVHRDIKPANIMLGEYGETLVVDWGLAKKLSDSLPSESGAQSDNAPTESAVDSTGGTTAAPLRHSGSSEGTHDGSVVGTPWYMSPEQAAGAIDLITPAADIYSLGATLYHILVGKAPLQFDKRLPVPEVLRRVMACEIEEASSLNPRVPKALSAICAAAMQPAGKQTYSSARALAEDIESYLADQKVSVVPETVVDRASRWFRKHRGIANALAASLVIIAVIAVGAYAITQSALTTTNRLLAIATYEQEYDSTLSVEKERIAKTNSVDEMPIDSEAVRQAAASLSALEKIKSQQSAGFVDSRRRERLLEAWQEGIERLLDSRMNRNIHQLLNSELSRLEEEFPWQNFDPLAETVASLKTRVGRRMDQWYALQGPSLEQLGFEQAGDVYSPPEDSDEPIAIADADPGNQQISVEFGGNWQQAVALGVELSRTDTAAYRFVVASESYNPEFGFRRLDNIAESLRQRRLAMFITREDSSGATVLRLSPVNADRVAELRFPKLIARRENGTLLTMIFANEKISFDDPFPLPAAAKASFGVLCPKPAGIADLVLEAQRVDSLPTDLTELELGDRQLAIGNREEALRHYERLPNSIEALFKRAILIDKQPDQYVAMLRTIIDEHTIEGVTDPRERQFYLYAGVRLLLEYQKMADHMVQQSIIVDRLKTNFDINNVQELIPEYDRATFSDALLKPGKRSRLVFDNENEVAQMQAVFDMYGDMFSNNPVWQRLVRWRLADAYQAQWDADQVEGRSKSRQILESLLVEIDGIRNAGGEVTPLELTTLVRDLVWLELLDAREEAALKLIGRYLPERPKQTPDELLPMLVDRARVHMAMGNQRLAQADLEQVVSRIDPTNPPNFIHHTNFAEASAILGMIYDSQGDEKRAQSTWLKGRRRNWKGGFEKPSVVARMRGWDMILESEDPEPYLQSKTDGYTEEEIDDFIDVVFAGSGMDDLAIRKMIRNNERVPREWIRLVAERAWTCERGAKLGESMVLHQTSMRDSNVDAVAMIFYTAVLYLSLDGDDTLEVYPEAEAMLNDLCHRLIGVFQTGKLKADKMPFILSGFTGSWNAQSYEEMIADLDDQDLESGLALVFARMLLKTNGNLETAKTIINQYVLPFSDEIEQTIVDIAKDTLREYALDAT